MAAPTCEQPPWPPHSPHHGWAARGHLFRPVFSFPTGPLTLGSGPGAAVTLVLVHTPAGLFLTESGEPPPSCCTFVPMALLGVHRGLFVLQPSEAFVSARQHGGDLVLSENTQVNICEPSFQKPVHTEQVWTSDACPATPCTAPASSGPQAASLRWIHLSSTAFQIYLH